MGITEEFIIPSTVQQCGNNDDIKFCSFYNNAMNRLLDINDTANVSCLHRYFKILNEYYDFWCQVKLDLQGYDDAIIKLLRESLYYRWAFVYRNATLLSSAVAFHFRIAYKQSPKNIKRLMKKKLMKICSLGGCAASDIVAIVTDLESIALKSGIELDFRVTIIESDERWKATCITILSCLKQFHKATWKITFIRGNLAKKNGWSSETFNAIQEADIIAMTRFLSKFNHKKKIMKIICNKLQPGALLFIFDRPLTELIEFSFYITESDGFELIHEEVCDLHSLDVEAVKYFNKLHEKQLGDLRHFRSNTSFNLFVGAWLKTSPESLRKCHDNIQCIFQNNSEKYNPIQNFLSSSAFTTWENLFMKKREADGWNLNGIMKYIEDEKVKRSRLLIEFIEERKKLEEMQTIFLRKLRSLDKDEKDANVTQEVSLESYLIQKRQYSLMKKNIYYYSFHSLY
ncbi:uncharacterized protein LOC129984388 [Argiope bruennichi]|uniref:uncharacterized protein LOC129984388 n=1 Tax=Argiope bruennichi TaxID=94029 RepID=UPI00249560E0|nr:uncharacterized protein LOC129984388 [Argiope bruennichi]